MPKVMKAGTLEAPAATGAPATVTTTVEFPEKHAAPKEKEKIEFWSYIAGLSPQDWKRHIVYLYRTKPTVGMGAQGKYLEKFTEAFTVDDIRTRFGGEEFRALLQRDRTLLVSETFAIEAAPKFDARENPPNGAAQAGALERVMEKLIDREREAGEGDSLTNKAAEQAIDLVTKGYETVLAKTGSTASGNGGEAQLLNTIRVLKDLGLIGAPAPRSMAAEFGDFLKMAKELGIVGQPQNQLSSLKDTLSVIKDLAGDMGIGGGGRRGGWAEVLAERAPDFIEKGVEAIGKYADIKAEETKQLQIRARAAQNIAAINRGAQPPEQPEIPTAMPGGIPPTAAPPAGIAATANAGGNAGAGGLDLEPIGTAHIPVASFSRAPVSTGAFNPQTATESEAEGFLFTFFKARVVQLIADETPGEDVVQFAQDFDPRIYAMLEAGTPESLRQFFSADPILSAATKLPRWEAFFAEACNDLYGATTGAVKPN